MRKPNGQEVMFLLFELAERGGTLFDYMVSNMDQKIPEQKIISIAAEIAR